MQNLESIYHWVLSLGHKATLLDDSVAVYTNWTDGTGDTREVRTFKEAQKALGLDFPETITLEEACLYGWKFKILKWHPIIDKSMELYLSGVNDNVPYYSDIRKGA